jgi:hypothetical protein
MTRVPLLLCLSLLAGCGRDERVPSVRVEDLPEIARELIRDEVASPGRKEWSVPDAVRWTRLELPALALGRLAERLSSGHDMTA